MTVVVVVLVRPRSLTDGCDDNDGELLTTMMPMSMVTNVAINSRCCVHAQWLCGFVSASGARTCPPWACAVAAASSRRAELS